MQLEDTERLIKSLKKQPLPLPEATTVDVDYGKDLIHCLIPHRAPFSLVDFIKRINLPEQTLGAEATISKEDPVFQGHFPGQPIYPGVLQIELMAQAGLCLSGFVLHQTTQIKAAKPVRGWFTRVHNAGFIGNVLPGDHLEVRAQLIEFDVFLGIVAAQILKDDHIISHCICEVYFPE